MKRRVGSWITIGAVVGMLGMLTAADLAAEDRTFSQTENRILAKRPEFGWKELLQGKYTEKFESYVTDQFVGRDTWIGVKTRTDIALGKKDVGGVYLGKGGYLIEQHLPEDVDAAKAEKKVELLEALVKEYEGKAGQVKALLVPTADNVWTDRLPDNAAYFDQEPFLSRVKAAVGEEHFIDAVEAMQGYAEEEIYYRTDHHWTTLGAYYGYEAWARSMGMTPVSYGENERVTVTEDFLGTLHSKVNIPVSPDSIEVYGPSLEQEVKVYYDFGEDYKNSLYEEKYLEGKDKYGYFLDGNHPFARIETGAANGKTLFVIKDSYANCFIPFAAQHYETICIVDLRYYNMDLYKLIDTYLEGDATDILVLYNVVHFISDFQYYRFS